MTELSQSPDQASKLTRVFSRTPSSWDPQDDLLLRHLKEQQKLGWKEIASHFAHRTPNACQFRWRRLRSGSLKSSSSSAPAAAPGALVAALSLTPASSSMSTPTASSSASGSTPPNAQKEISTSPSASPPPVSSAKNGTRKQSASSFRTSSSSQPMAVPSYNQWSFASKEKRDYISRPEEPGTDPLSSSLNSLNSLSSGEEENKPWAPEEDELLLGRRKRALSFAELSILLPSRSEIEIHTRIGELETSVRSDAMSAVESRESVKMAYLSGTPQRHKRHSHSHHHLHHHSSLTPSSRQKSERSFSVSSQTSTSSANFLTGDGVVSRSLSFSYNPPVLFNNLQQHAVSERYVLRRQSMTSSTPQQNQNLKVKSRSNSIFRSSFTSNTSSAIDDEDEDVAVETKRLPPLGVLFNGYL